MLMPVEAELKSLSLKYRIKDGDRKNFSEASQATIKKQQGALERLKKEYDALKKELSSQQSEVNLTKCSLLTSDVTRLQDQIALAERKIAVEEKRMKDAVAETRAYQQRMLEMRRQMGSVNLAQENNAMIAKQIEVLENRLQKALVRFNEALTHNKDLREEIDNLRKERVTFDAIYKRLDRELEEKRAAMAETIDKSNRIWKEREEFAAQLEALRSKADAAMVFYHSRFQSLDELLEEDRQTQELIKTRDRERRQQMLTQEEASLNVSARRAKEDRDLAEQLRLQNQAQERQIEYEEAFAKIRQATGIDSIDSLVASFLSAEDQNFSLFNYVNELNNEIEKLEESIGALRGEVEALQGEDTSADVRRMEVLAELEERHRSTENMAAQFETKYGDTVKTLNGLKGAIQALFSATGCDAAEVMDLLGTAEVTESNMMQYLGVIEQRTHTILSNFLRHRSPASSTGRASASRPGPPQASFLLIVPPSTTEGSDGEEEYDEEDRPLTREELRDLSMRMLNKMEGRRNTKSKAKKPGKAGRGGRAGV